MAKELPIQIKTADVLKMLTQNGENKVFEFVISPLPEKFRIDKKQVSSPRSSLFVLGNSIYSNVKINDLDNLENELNLIKEIKVVTDNENLNNCDLHLTYLDKGNITKFSSLIGMDINVVKTVLSKIRNLDITLKINNKIVSKTPVTNNKLQQDIKTEVKIKKHSKQLDLQGIEIETAPTIHKKFSDFNELDTSKTISEKKSKDTQTTIVKPADGDDINSSYEANLAKVKQIYEKTTSPNLSQDFDRNDHYVAPNQKTLEDFEKPLNVKKSDNSDHQTTTQLATTQNSPVFNNSQTFATANDDDIFNDSGEEQLTNDLIQKTANFNSRAITAPAEAKPTNTSTTQNGINTPSPKIAQNEQNAPVHAPSYFEQTEKSLKEIADEINAKPKKRGRHKTPVEKYDLWKNGFKDLTGFLIKSGSTFMITGAFLGVFAGPLIPIIVIGGFLAIMFNDDLLKGIESIIKLIGKGIEKFSKHRQNKKETKQEFYKTSEFDKKGRLIGELERKKKSGNKLTKEEKKEYNKEKSINKDSRNYRRKVFLQRRRHESKLNKKDNEKLGVKQGEKIKSYADKGNVNISTGKGGLAMLKGMPKPLNLKKDSKVFPSGEDMDTDKILSAKKNKKTPNRDLGQSL